MRNLLLLAFALALAAPASAANRCDKWPGEGSGPTQADLQGCMTEDLFGLIDGAIQGRTREQFKRCVVTGGSMSQDSKVDDPRHDLLVELRCRDLFVWLTEDDLNKKGYTLLPREVTNTGTWRFARLADLRPLLSLKGSDLTSALDQVAFHPNAFRDAVAWYEGALRREGRAERVERFLKSVPKP